jgi:RHS repeat-associated protein
MLPSDGNEAAGGISKTRVLTSVAYDANGYSLAFPAEDAANIDAFELVGSGGQYGYYTDVETGLLLLTNRYYDPAAGRFVTRDPIKYAGGINLYSYAGNNPNNNSDAEGLQYTSDRCNRIAQRIQNAMVDLEDTMTKYTPSTDWEGGFPNGHGGLTGPNGHYLKILALQASIISNISIYNANCSNGGPGLPQLWDLMPDLARMPARGFKGYKGPKFYPSDHHSNGYDSVHDDGFWLPLLIPAGKIFGLAGDLAGAAGKLFQGACHLAPAH